MTSRNARQAITGGPSAASGQHSRTLGNPTDVIPPLRPVASAMEVDLPVVVNGRFQRDEHETGRYRCILDLLNPSETSSSDEEALDNSHALRPFDYPNDSDSDFEEPAYRRHLGISELLNSDGSGDRNVGLLDGPLPVETVALMGLTRGSFCVEVASLGTSEFEEVMLPAANISSAVEPASTSTSSRAACLRFLRSGLGGSRPAIPYADEACEITRHQLGRMEFTCPSCNAKMWIEERKPNSAKSNRLFQLCCGVGKIKLGFPHQILGEFMSLLTEPSPTAQHFRNHIRAYNSVFGFMSSGAKFDRSLANNRAGVYTYRIQGAVYHQISRHVLANEGEKPKFAQIYVYDTDFQLSRRAELFPGINREIMETIQGTLHRVNPFIQQFQSHRAHEIEMEDTQDFQLNIIEPTHRDRRYDRPTGSEVAVLLPGFGDEGGCERDIILKKRGGALQTIRQYDGRYAPLHYVLVFPYGDAGWSIPLPRETGVTMNEFYRYHMMFREDSHVLALFGKLSQKICG